jgi:hypothetical protein
VPRFQVLCSYPLPHFRDTERPPGLVQSLFAAALVARPSSKTLRLPHGLFLYMIDLACTTTPVDTARYSYCSAHLVVHLRDFLIPLHVPAYHGGQRLLRQHPRAAE